MGGKLHRIFGVLDNIDLFASQLPNDRLHAHALHADTRADAIDVPIAAEDRDLGTFAGFPGAAFNKDGIVVNLGNFLFEQAHDQFRSSSGDDHTGVLARLFNTLDDATDAFAHSEALEAGLFFLWQAGFRLAEIT